MIDLESLEKTLAGCSLDEDYADIAMQAIPALLQEIRASRKALEHLRFQHEICMQVENAYRESTNDLEIRITTWPDAGDGKTVRVG